MAIVVKDAQKALWSVYCSYFSYILSADTYLSRRRIAMDNSIINTKTDFDEIRDAVSEIVYTLNAMLILTTETHSDDEKKAMSAKWGLNILFFKVVDLAESLETIIEEVVEDNEI